MTPEPLDPYILASAQLVAVVGGMWIVTQLWRPWARWFIRRGR